MLHTLLSRECPWMKRQQAVERLYTWSTNVLICFRPYWEPVSVDYSFYKHSVRNTKTVNSHHDRPVLSALKC
jgi:hypothetical protein